MPKTITTAELLEFGRKHFYCESAPVPVESRIVWEPLEQYSREYVEEQAENLAWSVARLLRRLGVEVKEESEA